MGFHSRAHAPEFYIESSVKSECSDVIMQPLDYRAAEKRDLDG